MPQRRPCAASKSGALPESGKGGNDTTILFKHMTPVNERTVPKTAIYRAGVAKKGESNLLTLTDTRFSGFDPIV